MADTNLKLEKRILKEAIELFKRNGYEKVSVNDICQASGIARSSFYLAFSSKRDIVERITDSVRMDREEILSAFVLAANDYERMWLLCDRYLSVALDFGPELLGVLFRMELQGTMSIHDAIHSIDSWLINLTRNCQKSKIFLSTDDAEIVAPLGIDMVYHIAYEWCTLGGSFNIRQRSRRTTEIIYNVAPQYRMSNEDFEKL